MKRLYKVGRWGSRADTFLLDLEQSSYKKVYDQNQGGFQSAGTVKFFIGGPVFLFNDEDAWFVWAKGIKEPIPLEELKISSKQKLGIFRELEIWRGSEKKVFSQLHVAGLLGKLDPTFDEFDRRTEDFIHHLILKQREVLKRQRPEFG